MIERVEVITNPSARYEADGMAGIINIVLRKERNQGFHGSFELITGTPSNFGGAANLNYRHRSEERLVGKGCVRTSRSPWSPYNQNNTHQLYAQHTLNNKR